MQHVVTSNCHDCYIQLLYYCMQDVRLSFIWLAFGQTSGTKTSFNHYHCCSMLSWPLTCTLYDVTISSCMCYICYYVLCMCCMCVVYEITQAGCGNKSAQTSGTKTFTGHSHCCTIPLILISVANNYLILSPLSYHVEVATWSDRRKYKCAWVHRVQNSEKNKDTW